MQYWLVYVLEVSFTYLFHVLVYILMVREWSLIYKPLCWGFFSSFEVTWSDVRPVLNVSFVFVGFTLWLRWKDLL